MQLRHCPNPWSIYFIRPNKLVEHPTHLKSDLICFIHELFLYFFCLKERKHIQIKYQDEIGVIKIDTPNAKVNSLGIELFPEFTSAFDELTASDKCKAIVLISGKTSSFIAGADIKMISDCKTQDEIYTLSRNGQKIFNQMEKSKKPIVSAIMGPCLGGGLEVALASQYRIAVNDTKTVVGLPEVKLGLLPGGGGTQRLPRLISLPDALDIALTGKMVKAKKAKSLGIVDLLVDPLGESLFLTHRVTCILDFHSN